jgi:hypothetical protein
MVYPTAPATMMIKYRKPAMRACERGDAVEV